MGDSEASFIFEGTVLSTEDATLDAVEVDNLTAVVRVDRILRAPKSMEKIAGWEITIQLREPAEVGTVAVFYANGWLYGDSLAVIEVEGRRTGEEASSAPEEAAVAGLETAAAGDRAARFRSALRERADEVPVVVIGKVTNVAEAAAAKVAATAEEERRSEHDPHWSVATVEVEETVKGKSPSTMDVMFANSEDVMWRDAPKLAVGQRAVMMLQKGAPGVKDKRAHVVLHELDVQPADSADLVNELL